jgi:hypothetical protein
MKVIAARLASSVASSRKLEITRRIAAIVLTSSPEMLGDFG